MCAPYIDFLNFFPAPEDVPSAQKCFTKEDWVLLDAMGASPVLGSSGKFLTMHKRRRKKLTTRSLLQDLAILDDIHHGIVQVRESVNKLRDFS